MTLLKNEKEEWNTIISDENNNWRQLVADKNNILSETKNNNDWSIC